MRMRRMWHSLASCSSRLGHILYRTLTSASASSSSSLSSSLSSVSVLASVFCWRRIRGLHSASSPLNDFGTLVAKRVHDSNTSHEALLTLSGADKVRNMFNGVDLVLKRSQKPRFLYYLHPQYHPDIPLAMLCGITSDDGPIEDLRQALPSDEARVYFGDLYHAMFQVSDQVRGAGRRKNHLRADALRNSHKITTQGDNQHTFTLKEDVPLFKTATFYSVSRIDNPISASFSSKMGLGRGLGANLLRQTAQDLVHTEKVNYFCTLSPVTPPATSYPITDLIDPATKDIALVRQARMLIYNRIVSSVVNPAILGEEFRKPIKLESNRCPVARFHTNNGASLDAIIFGADVSKATLQRSMGIQVRYWYGDMKSKGCENTSRENTGHRRPQFLSFEEL